MISQEFFTNYPSRLLWSGGAFLSIFVVFSGVVLFPIANQPIFALPSLQGIREEPKPLSSFYLGENEGFPLELPSIDHSLSISLSPCRPDCDLRTPIAHVRIKETHQSQRLTLPGRIYLSFNQGILGFEKYDGPFWIDLALTSDESLKAQVIVVREGKETCCESFTRRPDEPAIQKNEEFPQGSPIRTLGDSFWWGVDLLSQLNSPQIKQRLEIGSKPISLAENEWIAWKEDHWAPIKELSEGQDRPIARIRSISPQQLEWDVWDSSYVRLSSSLQTAPTNHFKTEELLNSLRIRSEKRISCALEKQCIILRLGDWVLKENGRWRVLRRAEERQQLIKGNKAGELFILDKIDSKQKAIKGRLFLANHAQMFPIESRVPIAKQDKKNRPLEHVRPGKNT